MRICTSCKETKADEDFHWRSKKAGTRRSHCKVCVSKSDAEKYANGQRKGSTKETKAALKERNSAFILGVLKESPCVDCGNSDTRVLEFDHLRDKRMGVARMMTYSIETIKAEIAKCEVVCANCHRIRTYSRMKSCYRITGI